MRCLAKTPVLFFKGPCPRISLKHGNSQWAHPFWQGSDFTLKANTPLVVASPGSCLLVVPMLPACPLCCRPLTSVLQSLEKVRSICSLLGASLQSVLSTHNSFLWRTWQWKGICYYDGVTEDLGDRRKNISNSAFQLLKSMGNIVLGNCIATWLRFNKTQI